MPKIDLPENYKPSKNEEYMNPMHLEYFRRKLEEWRKQLIQDSKETLKHLQEDSTREPDPSDQATVEADVAIELRTRDRYKKLLNKIEQALKKIENKDFGYCEETGEEIGLGRLEARPVASLTIEAQERRERNEKQFLDDD